MKNETALLFDDGRLTGNGAHELLGPHYLEIASCINAGVHAWKLMAANNPELCLPLVSRTQACIIHDHMEKRARDVFEGREPDIILSSEAGFLIVDFYGKIKMRFKKLSDDLHPYNIKTNQQRACEDQTLYAPPAALVTCGYRLDSFGLFRDAHIACWAGSTLLWSLRLPELDEGQQPIELAPGISPLQPIVAKKARKVEEKYSARSV